MVEYRQPGPVSDSTKLENAAAIGISVRMRSRPHTKMVNVRTSRPASCCLAFRNEVLPAIWDIPFRFQKKRNGSSGSALWIQQIDFMFYFESNRVQIKQESQNDQSSISDWTLRFAF